ncbi:MAG TPA: c-type cytochrome [Actinomycetota bacterium]|nr:c-type cytochrome [Actinomycetota bacterium]
MSRGDVITITLVVLGPMALLWGIYLMRTKRTRKPAAILGIPMAMRPAAQDEVLEGRRLERIQWGGVLSLILLLIGMVAYWLPEPQRHEAFAHRFDEEALHRGLLVYQAPPPLEEDISAIEFKEEEKALSLGQGCVNCHGPEGAGGFGTPLFKNPVNGEVVGYSAPPLNNVFQRWDEEIVRFTIERGRPGTDMPTWGVEYGGSMTKLMVDDVMAYLQSIQVPVEETSKDCKNPKKSDYMQCGQEIFEARCAVCHGPKGQGKEDPRRNYDDPNIPEDLLEDPREDDYPTWYQGAALWKGDVRHLSEDLHFLTIYNGRRFAFMPPFGEAPVQGIPVPPNPLTDKQIRAVMEYERSL